MVEKDIKLKILELLQNNFLNRDLSSLQDDTLLGEEGLGIDSLTFLKFLTELEKDFGIRIEDDYWEYKHMNTLSKIVNYVHTRLKESQASWFTI